MSPPYWTAVAIGAVICLTLTLLARYRPGEWSRTAARVLAVVLAVDYVTSIVRPIAEHTFTVQASLPLSLCDIALVVAAFGCGWPDRPLLVELTYFWGLAGSLQGVLTPDLTQRYPQLQFFVYTVGHMGIVTAAIFLVAGMRRYPRRRAVVRIWLLTLAYAAALAVVDACTGANYMFLAQRPSTASLLSVLGPWPWYILSAAGVSIVFLAVLDAPFWPHRRLVSE
jgi:hypothetical integral membrane protein (TIGR02206 family)